jgi:hypothetical protein
MVLAYPSGRLKGRLDASFVAVVYIFGIAYPATELTDD